MTDDTDVTRLPGDTPETHQTIGPYVLLQFLGEGGMGEVWLAQQTHPVRRQLAVKVLKAGVDTARVVARFEAERQALAVMDHPAIAKVFDGGTTPDGRPYFAMEYVRGEPITVFCDRHRQPVRERLELFVQLCDGVQHAHHKGIIHRDLKPSNVLVAVVDDRPMLRIIDFGIAKAIGQPLTDQPLHTEIGTFIGTPEYMSPEQADMSTGDIDLRSDVYSLGVILYELLVGRLPFDPATLRQAGLEEMLRTIREQDPQRPSTRVTEHGAAAVEAAQRRHSEPARLQRLLRGELDWIVLKALEKDRTRRYATANALGLDVRRHLADEPVAAGPPTARYQLQKFVRRHTAGVAAAALLVLLLVAFSVTVAMQSRRIASERDRANQEAATAREVSSFLVGLFRTSDPRQARGSEVTARQALDRGARELESLREQPEIQARLQATIGDVYTTLGAYDAARPLLEQSVATHRRVLGEDHPDTLAAVHLLANLHWYQRRVADAETLYLDLTARRTRLLGARHRDTLKTQYDLASAYFESGKVAEAEQLQRQVLNSQEQLLGRDDIDTSASRNNLVGILHRQKRFADSMPLAVETMASRRRVLGEDHPSTLVSMHNLAFAHHHVQQFADAERVYLDVIERKRRVLGDDHPSTSASRKGLSDLYETQKRYSDAEPVVKAAHEGYLRSVGADDRRTRDTATALARISKAAATGTR